MWDEDLFWQNLDDSLDLMWERVFGPDEPVEPLWSEHVYRLPPDEGPVRGAA